MAAKAHYTQQQREAAMRNNHALHYAQEHGYNLVREGQCYRLKEHDSMVFTRDGYWHWNSRCVHGRAVEFIAYYELNNAPDSLVQAILILAGETPGRIPETQHIPQSQTPPAQKRLGEFQCPKRSPDSRRLTAYLCQTRGISIRIVQEMLGQKVLYESVSETGNGNTVHNACFVSYGPDRQPCSAFLRGLNSFGKSFKMEVEGGDKRWGWLLRGKDAESVYVFEACIDAASYATLLLMEGEQPFYRRDFLALGGLSMEPLRNYLHKNRKVKQVYLLLDADAAGQEAVKRFQPVLEEKGYLVTVCQPSWGKDWNDTLVHYRCTLPQVLKQNKVILCNDFLEVTNE